MTTIKRINSNEINLDKINYSNNVNANSNMQSINKKIGKMIDNTNELHDGKINFKKKLDIETEDYPFMDDYYHQQELRHTSIESSTLKTNGDGTYTLTDKYADGSIHSRTYNSNGDLMDKFTIITMK